MAQRYKKLKHKKANLLGYLEGADIYEVPFSLQSSSLAETEAIWVGANYAQCPEWPKCQRGCCNAHHHLEKGSDPAVGPTCESGLIKAPARLHLDKKGAKDLGEALIAWAADPEKFWEDRVPAIRKMVRK